MNKALAVILALVAPLLFPTLLASLIVLALSFVVPPVGLVAGVLTDSLYHTPGQPMPLGTLIGGSITLIAYGVHRFVKTRIM